jgi:hypothetical protein
VTISVAHLHRDRFIPAFFLNFPLKGLTLLFSVEYFRRAYPLGFLLRPLGVQSQSIHKKEGCQDFFLDQMDRLDWKPGDERGRMRR